MLRFAVMFWRVLSSRAVKVLIYLWVLLWGFDRAIFWATEAAWFGSVGQSAWFGARFWTQFALFWGTLALALVSAALAMRIAARPAPGAELRALPPALERLEPARRGANRLAWLVLGVGAWSVARQVAGGWALVLAARAGQISEPIYGLPLARLILNCAWQWSLLLLGALAFAGVLRALPVLAQREPVPPLRLWRALSGLGILALAIRGALYALSLAEANFSDGITGAELFVGWPLGALGIGLCALAALCCLRRPAGYKKLGVAVAAALFAPHLLRVLLAPIALVVPTPATFAARNRAQTRRAWGLDNAAPIASKAPPLAAHWPIWNEAALLGLALGQYARPAQQIIDWKRATVGPREAIVAGVPAGLENWGSPHDADASNGIEWLSLDPTKNGDGAAPVMPDASLPLMSFYGLGGRALLGDNTSDAGVPFGFWGWKFAWAWRLRDPLLMLEGARAGRLLVYRGARESAERLAPFLTWDEAQLRMTGSGPRWEMAGYASTPYYRGALAAREGEFAGHNAAQPAVVLSVDPRNGRVGFGGARGATWSRTWAQITNASFVEKALAPTPETPMLEAARAQMARELGARNLPAEPLWTWRQGRGQFARYAPNLPTGIGERLAALDGAARREATNIEGAQLQNGDALLWPDARAPGGFWVGRPYYLTRQTAGTMTANGLARSAKLWRVSLTGLADSPLAHGDDASAALVAFDLQNAPPAPIATAPVEATVTPAPNATVAPGITPAPKTPNKPRAVMPPVTREQLALQALRAHDAAQKAASASDWGEWDKQSARERKLLEELASRKP